MMAINFEQIAFDRLDEAITWAVAHPEEFNMAHWFARTSCGTTACLAGTIAVQAGYKPVWDFSDGANCVQLPDGPKEDVWTVAARLLGFDSYYHLDTDDEDPLDGLFYAGSLPGVIAVRNAWAREAGTPERTGDLPEALR